MSNLTAGKCLISGGSWSDPSTSANTYIGTPGHATSATEDDMECLVSAIGIIKNLYVRFDAQPGSGKSWTVTLRKNRANTALTVTISDTAQEGSDKTHVVSVSPGDRICILCTPTNTPATAELSYAMEFEFNGQS